MKRLLAIALILFATTAYATTFVWDHSCVNTTGFKLYYGTKVMGTVLCPDKSLTMFGLPQGNYTVTAYNQFESDHSGAVLLAAYYYNSIKYDYNESGVLQYKGEHTDVNALESDLSWVITKYYYSGDIVVATRIRTTSWTNRTVGW